jgi:hypothetical protein
LSVLNQQINVVGTHLHNLELVRQGTTANLPDADEMTADAVKAEEVLAELEAVGEIAGTSAPSGMSGMTAEEKALFDELEAEAKGPAAAAEQSAQAVPRPPVKQGAGNLPSERAAESNASAPPARHREPEAS